MASVEFNGKEVRAPIMRAAVTVMIILAASGFMLVQPIFWLFGFRGPMWIEDRCLRIRPEGSFKRK